MALVQSRAGAKVGDWVKSTVTGSIGQVVEVDAHSYGIDTGDDEPEYVYHNQAVLLDPDSLDIKMVEARHSVREEIAKVSSTVSRANSGYTNGDSGAHYNAPVPNQRAQDAGRSHENLSVHADRIPGELPEEIVSLNVNQAQRSNTPTTFGEKMKKPLTALQIAAAAAATLRESFEASDPGFSGLPALYSKNGKRGEMDYAVIVYDPSADVEAFQLVLPDFEADAEDPFAYGGDFSNHDTLSRALDLARGMGYKFDPGAVSQMMKVSSARKENKTATHPFRKLRESRARQQVNEASSTVGLYAGLLVRVTETSSGKRVDQGIIQKMERQAVILAGGERYEQSKYTFLKLA